MLLIMSKGFPIEHLNFLYMSGTRENIAYNLMILGVAGNIQILSKLDLKYLVISLELRLPILSMLIIKLILMTDKLE